MFDRQVKCVKKGVGIKPGDTVSAHRLMRSIVKAKYRGSSPIWLAIPVHSGEARLMRSIGISGIVTWMSAWLRPTTHQELKQMDKKDPEQEGHYSARGAEEGHRHSGE